MAFCCFGGIWVFAVIGWDVPWRQADNSSLCFPLHFICSSMWCSRDASSPFSTVLRSELLVSQIYVWGHFLHVCYLSCLFCCPYVVLAAASSTYHSVSSWVSWSLKFPSSCQRCSMCSSSQQWPIALLWFLTGCAARRAPSSFSFPTWECQSSFPILLTYPRSSWYLVYSLVAPTYLNPL